MAVQWHSVLIPFDQGRWFGSNPALSASSSSRWAFSTLPLNVRRPPLRRLERSWRLDHPHSGTSYRPRRLSGSLKRGTSHQARFSRTTGLTAPPRHSHLPPTPPPPARDISARALRTPSPGELPLRRVQQPGHMRPVA